MIIIKKERQSQYQLWISLAPKPKPESDQSPGAKEQFIENKEDRRTC